MAQTPLDTIYKYETPEGVDLQLCTAGLFVRGAAWAVDCFIRLICYGIIGFLGVLTGYFGIGIMLILFFFIEWFYYVFFEVYNGQTPGKSFFNIKVVMDNGAPLLWSAALIRNFLRVVDYLPFGNALGTVVLLFNPRFQRIGDIAAGTLVIYGEDEENSVLRKGKREKRGKREAVTGKLILPPPQPLTPAEQGLIFEYCQRTAGEEGLAELLSAGRSEELAAMLPNLTGEYPHRERLLALGQWLLHGFERVE